MNGKYNFEKIASRANNTIIIAFAVSFSVAGLSATSCADGEQIFAPEFRQTLCEYSGKDFK